jgi:hypothetical protein
MDMHLSSLLRATQSFLTEGKVEKMDIYGLEYPAVWNPSLEQLIALRDSTIQTMAGRPFVLMLRGLLTDPNNAVVWDGYQVVHTAACTALGIHLCAEFYLDLEPEVGVDMRGGDSNAPAIQRLLKLARKMPPMTKNPHQGGAVEVGTQSR